MANLRIGPIESDKPVRVTIELPAAVHRNLLAYADAHAKETGQQPLEPTKLIGPMLERFMATDRGFAKARRTRKTSNKSSGA
ncbi:MAG: DUF2274 domain-containing protein [Rhizomicrobium sp.]